VREIVMERTNVRGLDADAIGGAVDLVVADLSFISLLTVAPALQACATAAADFVLLVKPQFEAGRARVGKGGIVRDPDVHRAVLREVRDGLAVSDLRVVDAVASPLRGADGNAEFLFHALPSTTAAAGRHGPAADVMLDALVDAVADGVAAR